MTSSKDRLRQFLLTHVGRVVTARDLQRAVGPDVTEWARRVRELRNEEGWQIHTKVDDHRLKPGEYRLVKKPPPRGSYRFSQTISARVRAQVLIRNGTPARCAGPQRETQTRSTLVGRFDSTSATSWIGVTAVASNCRTCAPYVALQPRSAKHRAGAADLDMAVHPNPTGEQNRPTGGPEMATRKVPSVKPRRPGRPVDLVMPPRIPDTPENLASACMQGPPKQKWDYLKPKSWARGGQPLKKRRVS